MTDHFCPIDHIAIDVVDFDTALAFFKDVFGMTVTRFQGPEEAPTSLWLDGGVQLCRVEAQAADTGRVGHIAFKTDDLDGRGAAGHVHPAGDDPHGVLRHPAHLRLVRSNPPPLRRLVQGCVGQATVPEEEKGIKIRLP